MVFRSCKPEHFAVTVAVVLTTSGCPPGGAAPPPGGAATAVSKERGREPRARCETTIVDRPPTRREAAPGASFVALETLSLDADAYAGMRVRTRGWATLVPTRDCSLLGCPPGKCCNTCSTFIDLATQRGCDAEAGCLRVMLYESSSTRLSCWGSQDATYCPLHPGTEYAIVGRLTQSPLTDVEHFLLVVEGWQPLEE